MGLVTRNTKTGGNTTFAAEYAAGFRTIKASEVDAYFKTVYDVVNGNLESTNLGANAVGTTQLQNLAVTAAKLGALAVEEAKIAANAVTTTKILDQAVTKAKLGIQSIVQSFQYGVLAQQSTGITVTPQQVLAVPAISVRGGYVLCVASWGAAYVTTGVSDLIHMQLRLGGSTVYTITRQIYSGDSGGIGVVSAPTMIYLDNPGSGTHTYTIWIYRDSATGVVNFQAMATATNGVLYAIELS